MEFRDRERIRRKGVYNSYKYKLTGFISKDLFRRMKMHCVSNDMTIREFLESAISEYLPE